ncbi:Murein DD-endopeptidase MepM [Halomicronema hongdechloris C2206]|uniref:Murein DD-endopeptidase MepM n=1 Tax=Halomicronema hongdechloris C2206 TaxID=1641165 RepID=A0A1Z3HGZ5_9CYAN|nr:M23 family metallopeptidase [Halomicronema hongdechloris]ASC69545.1 Murein DD-endopeptidase MepM [Halomicronema hongdechloris C2206]
MGWLLHRNEQLTERNQELTNTASDVLTELNSLDAEIENLRQRAGLPDTGTPEWQLDDSQGGLPLEVPPETLFQLARRRLPLLTSVWQGDVRPALEDTLAAEAARAAAIPSGLPVKQALPISSEFGLRPDPFGGRATKCTGASISKVRWGTPVYATAAAGWVREAENSGGYGNHVVVDHGYGYKTLYAHLSEIAVTPGTSLQPGELVGYLGNTGRSSGPHLHYEVHHQDEAVDPSDYLEREQQ